MTLQEANKAIKDAWVAGVLTVIITLTLTFIYATGAGITHLALWNVIDIFVLAALSYGIYRKSSLSAIIMLVYYLGSKIVLWADERAFIGVPIALIFAYFFWRGVLGTRAYHQLSVISE
ncbi:MAG: hypothetical protein H6658_03025 [Ardenticatenaceae bacterium]|nr:hypothetical protein [Ardenticatenaceae bacterium]